MLVYEDSSNLLYSSNPIKKKEEIPEILRQYFEPRTILPATEIFGK